MDAIDVIAMVVTASAVSTAVSFITAKLVLRANTRRTDLVSMASIFKGWGKKDWGR